MAEDEHYEMSDEDYERTKKLALLGDEEAVTEIGSAFLWGWHKGVKDRKMAERCYLYAAEKGYAPAMTSCGNLYFIFHKELDISEDDAFCISRKWFEKAAEAGDKDAYYMHALNLRYGTGGERDYTKAVEWFEKDLQATKGTTRSIAPLGDLAEMYERGMGCEPDLDKAMAYLDEKAAIEAEYKETRKSKEETASDGIDETPYKKGSAPKKPVSGKRSYRPVKDGKGGDKGGNSK